MKLIGVDFLIADFGVPNLRVAKARYQRSLWCLWGLLLIGCTNNSDLLRRHVADPLPASLTILKSEVGGGKDAIHYFAASCRPDEAAALTSHPSFQLGDDAEEQYAVRLVRQGLGTSLSQTGVTVHLRSAHGGTARVVRSSNSTNVYIIIATRLSRP